MFVISLVKLKEQCTSIYGNTVLKYHFKVLVHYWSVLHFEQHCTHTLSISKEKYTSYEYIIAL